MNKLLLFLITITLICCCNKQPKTDNFNFKELIEKDISDLTKVLTDLDTIRKESDWVEGDKQFYKLWLEGAKCELNSDFNTAIKHYKEALDVTRYEMSTYEIKLPLGRAFIQNGNNAKAKSILNEFRKEAEYDINNEDAEWGLSEEGKASARKEIELSDKLLSLINK
jgi:hypothetical protein